MAKLEAKIEALHADRREEFLTTTSLSRLLEIAHEDLLAVVQKPNMTVKMSAWVDPGSGDHCAVCLAGAVLVNRLGHDPKEPWMVRREFGPLDRRMVAINSLRMGNVSHALHYMSCSRCPDFTITEEEEIGSHPLDRTMSGYWQYRQYPANGGELNPKFHHDIRKLISDLKAAGL